MAKEKNRLDVAPGLVLESTQMLSPILGIHDGIVITKEHDYVQILEFDPINFHLFPENEQDAIADAFGAALAAFPNRFQIKILSRKANAESHIKDYQQAYEKETNEKCRQMQLESIRKIQERTENSVSKRFFVAHAYEPKGGLRRPTWQEIRTELVATSFQIAQHLARKPCLNTLSAPIGDNDAQCDAIYQCMCRAEAETKSLSERITEVVYRYASTGKLSDENAYIHENEFLAPKYIDPSSSQYLIVDGKYIAYGYIEGSSYPKYAYSGWLRQLVDLGEGIDVDIFVQKRNTEQVSREITYSLQINNSNMRHKSDASADLDKLNDKVEAAEYIRAGLASRQALLDFSILLTVVADDPATLRWRLRDIKHKLAPDNLKFVPLHYRHLKGYLASLPLCTSHLEFMKKAKRNVLTRDFGSAYPFVSFEMNDAGGFMLGVNRMNLSPIFLNLYDRNIYSDGNVILLGPPGTGKTYCLQTMALALRQLGAQVIIIVPYKGYEYRAACEAVGGQFISLAPGSAHNINIMEIRRYDTTVKEALEGGKDALVSKLAAKIQQIHAFVSLLHPDINYLEKADLDEAARRTYKRFGISESNKSLLDPTNPGRYKPMPVLGDLYQTLGEPEFKNSAGLRAVLARFVTGSAKSFNGPTNVNLNNPYVVIDISEMPKELVPMGTFIANDYAIDCIRTDNTKRKAILNDEISRMIGIAGSEPAAEFILQNCKLVRGYNTIVVNATQDTNDFFALRDGVYGRGIMANSKIKIILRQEPQEAKTIQDNLDLSDEETANLPYYEPGEGLLVANRNHVEIKVLASRLEDELINSDPEHIKDRLRRKGVIT